MILYKNLGFGVRTQDAEIFKKRGSYDMIPHGKEIKVFTGSSNPDLADMICKNLGISLGKSTVTAFADGECSISINEPVRGVDVFIVQSTCKPVNDSLMELLVMIDAMKRASAGRITAVIPYFGYARQDRKAKARDPISAKLVANLLTVAGADRVLTMDLHAAQIQGFFDIPVDNLYGAPLFATHYLRRFGYGREDMVVVSPDVGSVARARSFAMKMGLGLAIVDKRREKANSSEVMNIIGAPLSDYQKAQLSLRESMPAINIIGYRDSNGSWYLTGTDTSGDGGSLSDALAAASKAREDLAKMQYLKLFDHGDSVFTKTLQGAANETNPNLAPGTTKIK